MPRPYTGNRVNITPAVQSGDIVGRIVREKEPQRGRPGSHIRHSPRTKVAICSMTRIPSTLAPILLVGILACGDGPTGPGLDPEASVSLGAYHACALSPDGQTTCWGVNSDGQVGTGAIGNAESPVPLLGDVQFVSLTMGFAHSCGLTSDGSAYCWGSNGGGRLGNSSVGVALEPMPVSGGIAFGQISAGGAHTCGVTDGSVAYCWGSNGDGQLGLRGLGPNCSGTCAATPTMVDAGFPVSHIAAGNAHTCALTPDGVAYCWGRNFDGQLGNGTLIDSPLPVLVRGGLQFAGLDAGGNHTCGLLVDGSVFCWGRNSSGQLGSPTGEACALTGALCSNIPIAVDTDRRFVTISAGGSHTCAIADTGTSHCWGRNHEGQIGNGEVFDVPVPQQVLGGLTLQSLSAGAAHTCGVSTDAEVYCWGDNFRKQIQAGTNAFRYTTPEFILSIADIS